MSTEADIIKIVAQATANGDQKWEPTAIENEFITTFGGGFGLSIRSIEDPNSRQDDYVVEFRDLEGRIIATVMNGIQGGAVSYSELEVLHNTARRKALKVDETLDAMLKSLKAK